MGVRRVPSGSIVAQLLGKKLFPSSIRQFYFVRMAHSKLSFMFLSLSLLSEFITLHIIYRKPIKHYN